MAIRRAVPWTDVARQFEDIPLLADFTRPFPDLLSGPGVAVGESFRKLAAALSKSKRTAAIQFTIDEGGRTRHWTVVLSPSGSEAAESAVDQPNLEIITDAATWTDIAGGRVAPLEAFGQGKVRVRGDIALAQLLARRLRK